jgi:hypothetical protein
MLNAGLKVEKTVVGRLVQVTARGGGTVFNCCSVLFHRWKFG